MPGFTVAASARDDGRALARAIGDRTAQAPVDCIDPRDARDTHVIDGTAIVYDEGNRVYVNRPTSGTQWLKADRVLVSQIDGGQLCRLDTVTLLDPVTRMQTGFVVLGRFIPYEGKR